MSVVSVALTSADGLDETPECSQQSQKDEETDEVPRNFAGFVESGADAVEDRARRRRGEAELRTGRPALAEHGGHRHEQSRGRLDAQMRFAKTVDPGNFPVEHLRLPEDVEDAEQENAENQPVEQGVRLEGDEQRC